MPPSLRALTARRWLISVMRGTRLAFAPVWAVLFAWIARTLFRRRNANVGVARRGIAVCSSTISVALECATYAGLAWRSRWR